MISAIVLAAGESRRMGRQKLLLPCGDVPMIRRVVWRILQSPVREVIVVTGGHGPEIRSALVDLQVKLVNNPNPTDGMLASIRIGVRSAALEAQGFMIALGDQPRVQTATVSTLIAEFRPSAADIVVPQFQNRRGHPLIFSARYREAVLTRYDDVGLRGLLREQAARVKTVPIQDAGVVFDVDTPADYDALRRGR